MTIRQRTTLKKQILERLTKNFTISSACRAIGIDRKTFYRWILEDAEFKREAYENIQESKKDVTDMAYTQLVHLINSGNLTAAMYWLNNVDPEINNKKIYITDEEIKELSSLLYNPSSFKKGQELLTTYVIRGKISENHAQFILKLFMTQMKIENISLRKTEAEIMSEVMLREKRNEFNK
jgi:transposase-like protein